MLCITISIFSHNVHSFRCKTNTMDYPLFSCGVYIVQWIHLILFSLCVHCVGFFLIEAQIERVCHEYTCFNSHQVHPIYPMKITAEKSVNTRKKAKHFVFQFLFFTQYSYIRSQCQIEIRPPLWQESMIFPSNLKCCFTCIT